MYFLKLNTKYGLNWFFVIFGDYIYFKLTFLSIPPFLMKFPVKMSPVSWSFNFFLLETQYEISPNLRVTSLFRGYSGLPGQFHRILHYPDNFVRK